MSEESTKTTEAAQVNEGSTDGGEVEKLTQKETADKIFPVDEMRTEVIERMRTEAIERGK